MQRLTLAVHQGNTLCFRIQLRTEFSCSLQRWNAFLAPCVCLCLIGKLLSPSAELPFSVLAKQLLLSCSSKPSVDSALSLMSSAGLRHPCSPGLTASSTAQRKFEPPAFPQEREQSMWSLWNNCTLNSPAGFQQYSRSCFLYFEYYSKSWGVIDLLSGWLAGSTAFSWLMSS